MTKWFKNLFPSKVLTVEEQESKRKQKLRKLYSKTFITREDIDKRIEKLNKYKF